MEEDKEEEEDDEDDDQGVMEEDKEADLEDNQEADVIIEEEKSTPKHKVKHKKAKNVKVLNFANKGRGFNVTYSVNSKKTTVSLAIFHKEFPKYKFDAGCIAKMAEKMKQPSIGEAAKKMLNNCIKASLY